MTESDGSRPASRPAWAWLVSALIAGGFLTSIVQSVLPDFDESRATDVQLVSLAMDLLTKSVNDTEEIRAEHRALRLWAVNTINEVATVKFDEEAQQALINGTVSFSKWGMYWPEGVMVISPDKVPDIFDKYKAPPTSGRTKDAPD